MNILKHKLTPAVVVLSLLIPVSGALASHPVTVETGSSTTAKITNLITKLNKNSISVSGKMKRTKRGGHVIIPGQVKIDLYDEKGKLFKTVNVNHKRHRHHVNMPYKFSSNNIPLDSHDVSKVVVTHK